MQQGYPYMLPKKRPPTLTWEQNSYVLFRIGAPPMIEVDNFSLDATELRCGIDRRCRIERSKGDFWGRELRRAHVSGGSEVWICTEVHGRQGRGATTLFRYDSRTGLNVV